MANLEAAETRLSFDDILEAVQDSGRGRWFLKEFENRLQQRDTKNILQAISRLENRMEVLGPQASNPDDLVKVRAAMAKARNDLLNLGLGKEVLSDEGRLFANLAEMARKALPVAVDSNQGIVRTLQLVEEIDRTISPQEDRGAKYFAADNNIFDRDAVAAKPKLSAVPATIEAKPEAPKPSEHAAPVAKKVEPVATGAKLVIRKTSETPSVEALPEAAALVAEPETIKVAPEPVTPLIQSQADLPAMDNPRIVIIRRKAEDMPEVTLAEDQANVSAA